MPLELKEGAVFVTDAHYPRNREDFLAFLDALISAPPPQLFMLGDMFEFLSHSIPYSIEHNRDAIERLNTLSQKCEIVYLEGNHDFLIESLFPLIKVVPLKEQPFCISHKGQKILLLHGDKYSNRGYRLYSALIRNPFFLKFLRVVLFDLNGRFIKKIYKKLSQKKICRQNANFEKYKKKLLSKYKLGGATTTVEGHNHTRATILINGVKHEMLSAFACDKSFFKVEFERGEINFKKMRLGAEQNEQA